MYLDRLKFQSKLKIAYNVYRIKPLKPISLKKELMGNPDEERGKR